MVAADFSARGLGQPLVRWWEHYLWALSGCEGPTAACGCAQQWLHHLRILRLQPAPRPMAVGVRTYTSAWRTCLGRGDSLPASVQVTVLATGWAAATVRVAGGLECSNTCCMPWMFTCCSYIHSCCWCIHGIKWCHAHDQGQSWTIQGSWSLCMERGRVALIRTVAWWRKAP
jgi:hypothetical protein